MIRDYFTESQLLLISSLNEAVRREVLRLDLPDFDPQLRLVAALTDSELFESAQSLFKSHLQLASAGSVTNVYLRAYVMAVNVIVENYERGFYLYEDSRFLLRSYLTLAHVGCLGRH